MENTVVEKKQVSAARKAGRIALRTLIYIVLSAGAFVMVLTIIHSGIDLLIALLFIFKSLYTPFLALAIDSKDGVALPKMKGAL